MSPLAPQPQRPAAKGGCRSASRAKIGEIAVPGCKPRSRARQSAQRTSPGWSRRCCRTTLSVRLESITGQSSKRSFTGLARLPLDRDQAPAAIHVWHRDALDPVPAPLHDTPDLPRSPAVEPELVSRDREHRNLSSAARARPLGCGGDRVRQPRSAGSSPASSQGPRNSHDPPARPSGRQ
jgi:hypothetical protein